jgi:sterol desaturase/sphingolipid hydroxylase (fatty acid hydroxylase superfamily)
VDRLAGFSLFPPEFLIYLGAFVLVAAWEGHRPALTLTVPTPLRWLNNFLWLAVNSALSRILTSVLAVAWAAMIAERGWGVLHWTATPMALALPLSLLALDLAGYGLHILLHKSPLLWRLHAIHHSDIDFDCTTGFRFHPLEGILSTGLKFGVIAAMGAPPEAVFAYESWVGLQNLYGHANARLPRRMEAIAHWMVVTPDMHRIHHSARWEEGMRNFGIVFPWWDRLFGTYQAEPDRGHEHMRIGLDWLRREDVWSFPKLFLLPFSAAFPAVREESPAPAGSQ